MAIKKLVLEYTILYDDESVSNDFGPDQLDGHLYDTLSNIIDYQEMGGIAYERARPEVMVIDSENVTMELDAIGYPADHFDLEDV